MTQVVKPQKPTQAAACLIVEDSDFDQLRVMRILAKTSRLAPVVAPTLRTARALLQRQDFALVLLDNDLPDGYGINFAGEIREDPRHKDTPIILVSDWPTPFVYDKAAGLRISMVLSKDEFQPKHIEEALQFARIRAASRR